MTQRFTVALSDELYHKLLEIKHQKKLAGVRGHAAMSEIVREALEQYLANLDGSGVVADIVPPVRD